MRKMLLPAMLALLICAGACRICLGARYYVDCSATGTVHDGSSWAKAYLHVNDAVAVAPLGGEIWVKTGVYHETPITLGTYLWLYGGFLGFETSIDQRIMSGWPYVPANGKRGMPAFPSVIDVDQQGSVITVADNQYCTIDGFVLRNGLAMYGGGINCKTGTHVKIRNCLVTGCEATQAGGGVYYDNYTTTTTTDIYYNPTGSNASLLGCVITGNKALQGGGVVIQYHSQAIVDHCLITRNYATENGGGLFCPFHCDGRMYYSTVAYNSAGTSAGGAYINYGGNVQYSNCIIAFNSAPTAGGLGGGGGSNSLLYSYCDLYGNTGSDYGGNILPPSTYIGNYSADPAFLMPGLDEFHLSTLSPCNSAGCYAIETPCRIDRLGVAKQLPLGTPVRFAGKLVTCASGATTYAQEPDRATAIAVTGLTGYTPGQVLTDLQGTIDLSSDGIPLLHATSASSQAGYTYSFRPVATTGASVKLLLGMTAKVWGTVQSLTSDGFTVSDGSGLTRVIWGQPGVAVGNFVLVTGVYTLENAFVARGLQFL